MADGEDPTLDVQINVRANTQGAEEAKRTLRDVGLEARKAGEESLRASTVHGSAFGRIVTGSRNLSAAMRGVTAVMQGGIFTIGGFAQAFNALINVVRAAVVASGPFALLALAIGAIIGLMRGLLTAARAAANELKHTGTSAKELKDRLKEVDEESHKDLERMQTDVKALDDDFRILNERMKRTQEEMDAVAKASHELNLAQLASSEAKELAAESDPTKQSIIRARYASGRATMQQAFDVRGIENKVLRADLERVNAQSYRDQLRSQAINAELTAGGFSAQRAEAVGRSRLAMQRAVSEPSAEHTSEFNRLRDDAIVAARREQDALKNSTKIAQEYAQAQEKSAAATQGAQTARAVGSIEVKTEGVTFEDRQRALQRELQQKRGSIESSGVERAQQVQGEIESLKSRLGFNANPFDPAVAAMNERIQELTRVAEQIPNQTAGAINALTDAYQKQFREVRKLKQQIENARTFTTGQ